MREYHSSQGRWMSPDPAGMAAANPMNPQTWNRYAYVGGNPLSTVDPTGLCGNPGTACEGHWNTFDALSSQGGDCFGDPNCSTYEINGMPVPSAAFNGFVVGQGGAGLEFTFDPGSGISAPSKQNIAAEGDWTFGEIGSLQINAGLLPVVDDYFFVDVAVFGYMLNPAGSTSVTVSAATGSPAPSKADPTLDNRVNDLGRAINATGVQTLQNPCTPALFYSISTGGAILSGGRALAQKSWRHSRATAYLHHELFNLQPATQGPQYFDGP